MYASIVLAFCLSACNGNKPDFSTKENDLTVITKLNIPRIVESIYDLPKSEYQTSLANYGFTELPDREYIPDYSDTYEPTNKWLLTSKPYNEGTKFVADGVAGVYIDIEENGDSVEYVTAYVYYPNDANLEYLDAYKKISNDAYSRKQLLGYGDYLYTGNEDHETYFYADCSSWMYQTKQYGSNLLTMYMRIHEDAICNTHDEFMNTIRDYIERGYLVIDRQDGFVEEYGIYSFHDNQDVNETNTDGYTLSLDSPYDDHMEFESILDDAGYHVFYSSGIHVSIMYRRDKTQGGVMGN